MAGVMHIATRDIGNEIIAEFVKANGRYPSPEDYRFIITGSDLLSDPEVIRLNRELDLHRINKKYRYEKRQNT